MCTNLLIRFLLCNLREIRLLLQQRECWVWTHTVQKTSHGWGKHPDCRSYNTIFLKWHLTSTFSHQSAIPCTQVVQPFNVESLCIDCLWRILTFGRETWDQTCSEASQTQQVCCLNVANDEETQSWDVETIQKLSLKSQHNIRGYAQPAMNHAWLNHLVCV